MHFNSESTRRDLGFFLVGYTLAYTTALVPNQLFDYTVGALLVADIVGDLALLLRVHLVQVVLEEDVLRGDGRVGLELADPVTVRLLRGLQALASVLDQSIQVLLLLSLADTTSHRSFTSSHVCGECVTGTRRRCIRSAPSGDRRVGDRDYASTLPGARRVDDRHMSTPRELASGRVQRASDQRRELLSF